MISILPAQDSKLGIKIKNDTTGEIIFANFLSLESNVNLSSELMTHTKEDGSIVVDSKIVQPFEIDITGYVDSAETLGKLSKILLDRSHYYTVTVNGIPWSNCQTLATSIDSDAESISTYPVQIVFRQILARRIDYTKMAQAPDYPNRKFGDTGLGKVSMTVDQLYDKIRSMF